MILPEVILFMLVTMFIYLLKISDHEILKNVTFQSIYYFEISGSKF